MVHDTFEVPRPTMSTKMDKKKSKAKTKGETALKKSYRICWVSSLGLYRQKLKFPATYYK